MLCNIKPVPFHESDKHIFARIPGGGPDPRFPPPPSGSAHALQSPPKMCKLTLLCDMSQRESMV